MNGFNAHLYAKKKKIEFHKITKKNKNKNKNMKKVNTEK